MTGRLDSSWVNQSVSHGTLRHEDLIPAFTAVLEEVDMDRAVRISGPYLRNSENPEVISELLNDLFDAMDEIAPEGTYFGSIEGDGSDFGFWQVEEGEGEE